jgi:hypothetical protein
MSAPTVHPPGEPDTDCGGRPSDTVVLTAPVAELEFGRRHRILICMRLGLLTVRYVNGETAADLASAHQAASNAIDSRLAFAKLHMHGTDLGRARRSARRKPCTICGAPFDYARSSARYCSAACRKMAERRSRSTFTFAGSATRDAGSPRSTNLRAAAMKPSRTRPAGGPIAGPDRLSRARPRGAAVCYRTPNRRQSTAASAGSVLVIA